MSYYNEPATLQSFNFRFLPEVSNLRRKVVSNLMSQFLPNHAFDAAKNSHGRKIGEVRICISAPPRRHLLELRTRQVGIAKMQKPEYARQR